jgi:two-component system, LytTR family, sensor kinase
MKERTIKIIVHVLIWSAFLVLLLIFMPFYDVNLQQMPLYFFCMFVLLIGYYYFNSQVLVPWLLAPGKFLKFALVTIVIFSLYIYLSNTLDWMRPPGEMTMRSAPGPPPPQYMPGNDELNPFTPGNNKISPSGRNPRTGANHRDKLLFANPRFKFPMSPTLTFLLVFMVSTGTKIISFWFESERNKNRIEREKSLAELSALKAQLNPHFLFNTLNNIYYLASKKSETTPDVILKLSDLMRFVLTETTAESIPLEKEVECIQQYIDLQRLRLTDKTGVSFETTGEIKDHKIAPLLLLPFVENAFKFGVSTHTASTISISLSVQNGKLSFIVRNGKVNSIRSEESTGTGLSNVSRRLNLTYPGKHALKIQETDSDYDVELKIKLS